MPLSRTLFAVGAAISLAAGVVHAQIQTPNAAGFTAGTFNVDDGGAATYTIPITVPPGIAGMEPKLSLVYSSRGANGRLGVGWALTGLSSIARCAKTLARDGQSGGVNINTEDRFCLDGQRLMVIGSPGYGAPGSTYHTERETFSKITANGTVGTGPEWFEVRTKSGLILEYGNTADSKFRPQGAQGAPAVLVWGVSKIRDTKGNYLTVTYAYDNPSAPIDWWPSRIDYTYNPGAGVTSADQSVTFVYDPNPRPDVVPAYVAGFVGKTTNRLIRIETRVQATLVREYVFDYNHPDNGTPARSRLKGIQECGREAGNMVCVPATTFTVQTSTAAGLNGAGSGIWSSYNTGSSPWTTAVTVAGDYNGDGKTDLAGYTSSGLWRVCLSTGTSFNCTVRSAHAGGLTNNFVGDFDGDGKSDLIAYSSGSSWDVCLSNGSGFNCAQWIGHSGGNTNNLVGDFNGDGRTDIAGYSAGWQVCLSTGTGFTCTYWGGLTGDVVGDFNGDGRMDIAGWGGVDNGWKVCLSTGTGFECAIWQGHSGGTYSDDGSLKDLIGDFNGDGKTDIAQWLGLLGSNVWHVCLSTGTGFVCDYHSITESETRETVAADFNGDGRTDLAAPNPGSGWRICYSSSPTFNCLTEQANFAGGPGGVRKTIRAGDFNGDGLSDLAGYYWEYIGDDFTTVHVDLNVGLVGALFPDLMTQVTNGLLHETQISYLPLTQSAVYTKDSSAAYPDVDLQAPLYVVRSASSANGLGGWITTDYAYGGAKANVRDGHGFKGFRWREVTAQATGIKTRTDFRQDHPFIGLVSQVKRTHPNTTVLSQTGNEYGCNDFVIASGCVPAAGKRYFPFVSRTTERTKDLSGGAFPIANITTQFDGFGNPTTITASTDDGYSKITTNTYLNDTASPNWTLGRLTRTTVESTVPASAPPAPGPPTVSVSPSPLIISASVPGSASRTSTASSAGGMPPFTYSWVRLTGTRISVTGTQTATFSTTVNYNDNFTETFRLTAVDADGVQTSSDLSVTAVGPTSSAPPSVATTPASPINSSVTGSGTFSRSVTANVTDGEPPFTYSWTVLPGSPPSASIANAQSQTAILSMSVFVCEISTGYFRLTVTDSINRSATRDVTWNLRSTAPAPGGKCM